MSAQQCWQPGSMFSMCSAPVFATFLFFLYFFADYNLRGRAIDLTTFLKNCCHPHLTPNITSGNGTITYLSLKRKDI